MCFQYCLAWLGSGASCPEIPTGQLGSCWHCLSGKILPSWSKWQARFPWRQPVCHPPLPTHGHRGWSPRPLFLCDPCIFLFQGSVHLPMVLPSDRELDRLIRAGTIAAGRAERAEARPPFQQPPVCGRWRCQPGLRSCSREGWEAGCLPVRRLPVGSVEGSAPLPLLLGPVSFP